jgi:hypothetical protein
MEQSASGGHPGGSAALVLPLDALRRGRRAITMDAQR